jgi:hypothetical protein
MPVRTRIGVRNLSLALGAAIALLAGAAALADYPKPAPVPYKWELEFEPGPLRLYVDPQGDGTYWYFTYQVTNRTGNDQLWAPKFVLFTDAGEIIESGRNVPAHITEELLAMLGNDLLEDQNEALGDILQGRENAKEGLVIWRPMQLSANEISMFIAGISGETARVKNPANGQEIILRKTLQRDYLVPGSAVDRGSKPVDLVAQQWVLR